MPASVSASLAEPGIRGRYWTLAILTLVYTFNHIDRQILVILLEPIKSDLNLRDSQLGVLSGIAFAAFYATLGIPVAIWADRGSRRNIIAISLAIWSGMTALSGLAQSYTHLLLARMGVGIGEAGGTPPSTSMIADLFPPEQRATALGIYTTGIGIGIMAGFAFGGLVYEAYGWRAAFFLAGVPGLLLALIVYLTVPDPVRGLADQRIDSGSAASVRETLSFILRQAAFTWLLAGCLLLCIASNAFLVFTSSFLQRSYGLTPGEVSLPLGVMIGVAGSIGAILIGILCDRLSRRDRRWRPLTIAICTAIALPFMFMMLRAPTSGQAFAWFLVPSFVGLIYASIAYTATQELVQVRMRSFASAFMLFALTLVGIGGGPWLAGVLSEYLASQDAPRPLAQALEMMLLFNVASIFCLLMATRSYNANVHKAAETSGETQSSLA